MPTSREPVPSPRSTASAVLENVPPIMRLVRDRMREGRIAGISVPQFRALLYVRRRPGTDLSGVAEHLGTSLPAASELVARLVRAGLVVRETDPASRRRICLTLSEAGAAHLGDAEARTLEWLMGRLETADPARLGIVVDALRELRTLLEAEPAADAEP